MEARDQERVRDYLKTWSEEDWGFLDDLLNDGISLPAALVQVHRFKQSSPPSEVLSLVGPEPGFEQTVLDLA